MKLALYEFEDDGHRDSGTSIEIGGSSWICNLYKKYRCNEKFDWKASAVQEL